MKCQECQRQFDSMVSGQIETAQRIDIEAHLRECDACARAFSEARELWELLGKAKAWPASHGFADRVLRQLDARPEPAVRWWMIGSPRLRRASLGMAFVLTVIVATLTVVHFKHEERVTMRAAHFEDLFELVQNVDPDTVLNPAADDEETL